MHVNDIRLECGDRAPQMPPRPRVEPDLPRDTLHRDPVGRGPARQLAPLVGDEDLFDGGVAAELTAQQQNLLLAATPFTARVYLQHPHRRDLATQGLSPLRQVRSEERRV